jgi:hypothetical protein
MVYKVFFLIIFAFLFVYSLIRPFANIYSRLFLFFGSIAGIISLLGSKYANLIADYIGVENGSYLYLYIGLVTIFMFIFYSMNKNTQLEDSIAKLVRELAIVRTVHEKKIDKE